MWIWEGFWIKMEGCKGWVEVLIKKIVLFVLQVVNILGGTIDIIIH